VTHVETSPQSNFRRAHRKGPIGSDDIVRYSPSTRIANYSNSTALVFRRRMLSRPIKLGHANGVIALGTAGIAILRVITVTFVHISAQPPLRS